MTSAKQLECSLHALANCIRAGLAGEPLCWMIESVRYDLDTSLSQGDQIWVHGFDQRLTTMRQIINAVAQGYELRVIAWDGLQPMASACLH